MGDGARRWRRVRGTGPAADGGSGASDPSPVPDGGFVRIELSEWDRLVETLRAFDASVTADDDRVELRSGSASLVVTRDGRVAAGMPLHDFEKGGVEALAVDPAGGRVRVRDDGGLAYEFRAP